MLYLRQLPRLHAKNQRKSKRRTQNSLFEHQQIDKTSLELTKKYQKTVQHFGN